MSNKVTESKSIIIKINICMSVCCVLKRALCTQLQDLAERYQYVYRRQLMDFFYNQQKYEIKQQSRLFPYENHKMASFHYATDCACTCLSFPQFFKQRKEKASFFLHFCNFSIAVFRGVTKDVHKHFHYAFLILILLFFLD